MLIEFFKYKINLKLYFFRRFYNFQKKKNKNEIFFEFFIIYFCFMGKRSDEA